VRILSRHSRASVSDPGIEYVAVDLLTGAGIEPAPAGVDTVLHLAGANKGDDRATRNLVRAAKRAGVRHLVHISVIGADTMPLGWFRTQLAAEREVTESGIAWTMLRAARFHDLVLTMAEKMAKLVTRQALNRLRTLSCRAALRAGADAQRVLALKSAETGQARQGAERVGRERGAAHFCKQVLAIVSGGGARWRHGIAQRRQSR
jgi:uncharacterized protein YbjT (DUF2867 family)